MIMNLGRLERPVFVANTAYFSVTGDFIKYSTKQNCRSE
jgi:hypothetical protein